MIKSIMDVYANTQRAPKTVSNLGGREGCIEELALEMGLEG